MWKNFLQVSHRTDSTLRRRTVTGRDGASGSEGEGEGSVEKGVRRSKRAVVRWTSKAVEQF